MLATPDTIAIMQERYGPDCAGSFQALDYRTPLRIDGVTVTLYPAGHILGSAQVLLEHEGQRVVVTGDYKRLPDRTAQAFELVQCDLLVTEATFGLPVFQHPDPQTEVARLRRSTRSAALRWGSCGMRWTSPGSSSPGRLSSPLHQRSRTAGAAGCPIRCCAWPRAG